ncbi:MAG: hypothetical protein E7057_01095 [Lentisphaerae bacterium]|nr:hypothetical protein [Lentisphaerota bacterium]
MSFAEKSARVSGFIRRTFPDTMKPPSGILNHPYVAPGGPYANNLWDWDSYWTLFAVLADNRDNGKFLADIRPFARGTLFNFLEHQAPDGALPILIHPQDADPFDCLLTPDNNMAKPFLAQLTKLLWQYGMLSDSEIQTVLPRIQAFHRCYFQRYCHEATGLVLWAKDWGIGADDDPAIWGRPEKSCASIFLNSFLYRDLRSAAFLAEACRDNEVEKWSAEQAEKLAAAIEKYCWDEREKAFFSVDVQCRQNISIHRMWGEMNKYLTPFWKCLQLKVLSWSSFLPFWCGFGSQEKFAAFLKENMVKDRLFSCHGIRSLSADEPMYDGETSRGNPSNWLGPVWMIVNYLFWETLHKFGKSSMADELAEIIIALLDRDLQENGCLHEYYSPESGDARSGNNFMSWNALCALMKKGAIPQSEQ